jgi:hypothetical protein
MKRIIIFGIVLIVALDWSAEASPAIYTLSGIGFCELGTSYSQNASFTITSTADTSDIVQGSDQGDNYFAVTNSTATVSVSGLGTAMITDSTITVANQDGSAGIGDLSVDLPILYDANQAFVSYDLSTSLEPITGTAILNSEDYCNTTVGIFALGSISSVTFQADVVPEPSTFALLGIALVGLFLRRQKKQI